MTRSKGSEDLEAKTPTKVSISNYLLAEIDAIVEEHKGDYHPLTRSSLIEDGLKLLLKSRKASRKASRNGDE